MGSRLPDDQMLLLQQEGRQKCWDRLPRMCHPSRSMSLPRRSRSQWRSPRNRRDSGAQPNFNVKLTTPERGRRTLQCVEILNMISCANRSLMFRPVKKKNSLADGISLESPCWTLQSIARKRPEDLFNTSICNYNVYIYILGGGFKHFLCSSLLREMIQVDLRIFLRWVGSTTR